MTILASHIPLPVFGFLALAGLFSTRRADHRDWSQPLILRSDPARYDFISRALRDQSAGIRAIAAGVLEERDYEVNARGCPAARLRPGPRND